MNPAIAEAVRFAVPVVVVAVLILACFNWKTPISITRRVTVKAGCARVWAALDMPGADLAWHPHLTGAHALDDHGRQIELLFHHDKSAPSRQRADWRLHMDVAERIEGRRLVLTRANMAGRNPQDRLLALSLSCREVEDGCEVIYGEQWGPRSLAGRFSVIADGMRAAHGLKQFVETGKVDSGERHRAGMIVGLASAAVTVSGFAYFLGWPMALMLVAILVVHEFGHLLSFRLIGQPWGRLVFVPFIGGVAVSRKLPDRLSEDSFCALMGAGLSLVLLFPALALAVPGIVDSDLGEAWVVTIGALAALTGGVNVLNLLPIFPLDGGRVVRALARSLAPNRVKAIMLLIAAGIGIAAVVLQNIVVAALALVAFFQGARLGPGANKMAAMTWREGALTSGIYACLAAAHGAALWAFYPVFAG